MANLPLAKSDWRRETAEEPVAKVQNRFFEQNPTNLVEGASLVLRPGFKFWTNLGNSPVLSIYSQDGAFQNDTFVIQTSQVMRLDEQATVIGPLSSSFSSSSTSTNRACFSNAIGSVPSYFFFVKGTTLDSYCHLPVATNSLTFTAQPEVDSIVRLGEMYYKFVAPGAVNTGPIDGTSTNPWKVNRGAVAGEAFFNLTKAVNAVGTPGSDYSSILTKNPLVNADEYGGLTVVNFYAATGGLSGNTIQASVSATTVMSFASSSFTGGAESGKDFKSHAVPLPADEGDPFLREISVKAVTTINSYVIVVVNSQYNGTSGRFYWINPGETWIDPLSFATTESNPDSIVSVQVVGDQLWFLGRDSIEIWAATGDPDLPFAKINGLTMNYGALEGTDVTINNMLFFADTTGIVYSVSGGAPQRISTNSIEEKVRQFQQNLNYYTSAELVFKFRTWTYSADGHLFYILNLGDLHTFAYDVTSEQWTSWSNYNSDILRQHAGCPVFASLEIPYSDSTLLIKSNPVVVGDIYSGTLWVVDPAYRYDDNTDRTAVTVIETVFTTGFPARMRETTKCNEVYVTGSVGSPSLSGPVYLIDGDSGAYLTDGDGGPYLTDPAMPVEGLTVDGSSLSIVTLETSDDNGRTWVSHGSLEINPDEWTFELVWRSLGVIQAPGRIFRFTDYGSLARVDGVDMR